MEPRATTPVEIEVDGLGCQKLLIDGQDLLREVSGFGVVSEVGKPPVINVRLTGAQKTIIKGSAVVQIIETVPDPDLIVQFLEAVDPTMVETLALNNLGYGGDTVAVSMMKVLIQMAKGEV